MDLFPLTRTLQGIEADPGAYWWIYAIVFSTVLPTLLHAAGACLSLTTVGLPRLSGFIRARLDSADPHDHLLTIGGLVVLWTLSLALPLLAAFGIYKAGNLMAPGYLDAYLGWLMDLALWADPLR